MTKVAVSGLVVIFLVFYIVTSPANAADVVHNGWNAVGDIAHGLGQFINKLSS